MNPIERLAKKAAERNKERCYNGGKKHKYKSIWEEQPTGFKAAEFEGTVAQFESLAFRSVYIGEVCQWCGHTIRRDQLENSK
jgi:hypothetical protein